MIRWACNEDIEALVEMAEDMHNESPHYSRFAFSAEKVRFVARKTIMDMASLAGELVCLVAEKDNEIIGMMNGSLASPRSSYDRMAVELELFVRKEHRGGSTAARLIKAFEKWAFSHPGVIECHVGVSTGIVDDLVVSLYESLGYVKCSQGLVKYGTS